MRLARIPRRGSFVLFWIGTLFAVVAIGQSIFVHFQVYKRTSSEVENWANEIANELIRSNRMDLKGYRQASPAAQSWFAVTEDGLLLDIQGLYQVPHGVVPPFVAVDDSIFGKPQTVVTETGEKWRIFGKRLVGGTAVLGIHEPRDLDRTDIDLRSNVQTFGTTIEHAKRVKEREFDNEIDSGVLITHSGELELAFGGLPLQTDSRFLVGRAKNRWSINAGTKSYFMFRKQLTMVSHKPLIVVVRDVTLERRSLWVQDGFNLCLATIASFCAVPVVIRFLSRLLIRELINRRIGARFSQHVRTSFQLFDKHVVCVIAVQRAPEPVWLAWNDDKLFFVREGNRTSKLNGQETFHYIKNHW